MDKHPQSPQMDPVLSKEWKAFCERSGYRVTNATRSVRKGVVAEKTPTEVRGYYSKILLIPKPSDDGSIIYPTHDHIKCDGNNGNMAIESRLVNSMKSNLTDEDFWLVIDHLFAVRHEQDSSQNSPKFLKALASLKRSDEWFETLATRVAENSEKNQPGVVVRLKSSIVTFSGRLDLPITSENLQKAITAVAKDSAKTQEIYNIITAGSVPEDGVFPVQYLRDALDANAAKILTILPPPKKSP